jgi:AraC-like DNA-binding protein
MPTPIRVPRIHARLASKIVNDLKRRHIPTDDLLKEVGIRRTDLGDPDSGVSYAAVIRLMERAAALLGEPGFGLRFGASQDLTDGGILGFVMLNSTTLRDSLRSLERYFLVISDGEDIEFEESGPHVKLRFRERDPALRGQRQKSEYFAAFIVRACRDITRRRVSPVRVEFMHARPNVRIDYEAHLGCPVRFRTDWDAVVFEPETMQLEARSPDDKLLKILEMASRKIIGPTPKKEDIVHDVRSLIGKGLSHGAVHIDSVAAELNMSSKTLERRLSERGESFSALNDAIRQDIAKQCLRETDLRLEEIVFMVGYTDPATLVRAFKRWTGKTPMAFRAQHR